MSKPKKIRGKIKFKQQAIIQRKDNTNVARPDTTNHRVKYSPTPMPRTNGAVFKVKIRKRNGK